MKKLLLIVLALSLMFSSCSEYQKLLKSDDFDLKLSKAVELYHDGDYARALTLFEGIVPRARGTEHAEKVFYYHAYTNYNLGDYILGGYYFRNFAQTFANSEYAEECMFMGAYCYYLESPSPSLDQASTFEAINSLQLFIGKYPSSMRGQECNKLIDELRTKLEEKSYINAKLYYDFGNYKSAVVALQNSLKDYPDSEFREQVMFYLAKSQYIYASKSIDSKKDERFTNAVEFNENFKYEFPESKFIKEVERMNKNINEYFEKNS